MGSFTKIYTRNYHPEESLTLTWDAVYHNVEIYDKERLVKHWDKPQSFKKGVSFQDEKLGKIELKFSDTQSLTLELKVNGKKYKPTKAGKPEVDITGQISVYWTMMAFTLLPMVAIIAMMGEFFFRADSIIISIYLLIAAIIYFLSAILMTKKYIGAFFLAYCYMALHLLFLAFFLFLYLDEIFILGVLFFLIRLGVFIYLTLSIKKITFAIRMKSAPPSKDLLDEKF